MFPVYFPPCIPTLLFGQVTFFSFSFFSNLLSLLGVLEVSFDEKDKKSREVTVCQFDFHVIKSKKPLNFSFLEVAELQHPLPDVVVVIFFNKSPMGFSGASAHEFFEALLKTYDSTFASSPDRWTLRVRPDLNLERTLPQGKKMDGFSDIYRFRIIID